VLHFVKHFIGCF